ncbi:hypothetical protein BH11GEM1_BH11GEM1_34000 [soil metagenome]
MRHAALTVVIATAFMCLLACGDSGSGPSSGPPARLVVLDGANQAGVFGQPTAVVPSVLLTDASNKPVSGVSVTFAVTPGSGSVSSSTATTDATGTATPGEWRLGNSFATMALLVTVKGLPTVTFTAKAIAPDAGVPAFTLIDPAGDTLPASSILNPPAHDLLSMRGDFKRDSLILTMTFAAPVTSAAAGGATAVFGYIEFDIDENGRTGDAPLSNTFGASAAGGIDYIITLIGNNTTTVRVVEPGGVSTTAAVAYSGNTLVIRIPMQALGNDDGRFAVVGAVGTLDRPTDVFPNASLFSVRPNPSVASWPLALGFPTRAPSAPRGPPP